MRHTPPTFNGLTVSSKFAICPLPIRVDTYRTCQFGCRYCFSNGRKVAAHHGGLQVADIPRITRLLQRIHNHGPRQGVFLDQLIAQGITWHCGGMSDPFQPINATHGITNQLIDATAPYGISILFSTKSADLHHANLRPDLHTLQLSVTSSQDRPDIEPNVPPLAQRIQLYRRLKSEGFRVGIRLQPFIPGITTIDVLDLFPDADHYTIESLKLVVHNSDQRQWAQHTLGIDPSMWTGTCMMHLDAHYRMEHYQPFIDYFQRHNLHYSIADNDLRHLSTTACCCGTSLVTAYNHCNPTTLIHQHGTDYTLCQAIAAAQPYADCNCRRYILDNSATCPHTVRQYLQSRFHQSTSPISPKFQYVHCTALPLEGLSQHDRVLRLMAHDIEQARQSGTPVRFCDGWAEEDKEYFRNNFITNTQQC